MSDIDRPHPRAAGSESSASRADGPDLAGPVHVHRGVGRSMRTRAVGLVFALVLGGVAATAARAADERPPLRPVPAIDVQRYLGTWYEIAKLPNWFQRRCVSDTRAAYALREDGTLRVDNACRNAEGGVEQAIGAARGTGPSTFEVRFAPDWLAWLPFVWANYWVVDIDTDYTLAAVSEPGRRYLWVLSRTPSVAPERWQALIGRLQAMGLDTAALERTPQSERPLR